MTAGVMVLVGASDYLAYPEDIGAYIEPRYLLPMLVLFGAVLALAARGAGTALGAGGGGAARAGDPGAGHFQPAAGDLAVLRVGLTTGERGHVGGCALP